MASKLNAAASPLKFLASSADTCTEAAEYDRLFGAAGGVIAMGLAGVSSQLAAADEPFARGRAAALSILNASKPLDRNFLTGKTIPPPGLLTRSDAQPAALFERTPGSAGAAEYAAAIYGEQVSRAAITLSLQQAAARSGAGENGDGNGSSAAIASQQLEFAFFAESRITELAVFQARTDSIAEGLRGARQSAYLEASRAVAARFSLSLEVTGAALNGFANASDALQEDPADFDRFLGLVNDALAKTSEVLNRILELLDGFFQAGESDFAAKFQGLRELLSQFADEIMGIFQGAGEAGGSQAFQIGIQLEFSFEYSESIRVEAGKVQESDPIVLDLDGDGVELASYLKGARFDIEGAGRQVNTAFVTGGDAFLAMDRNGNGVIDSGLELFGDQHGALNGFEELRKLDDNGDGVIDRRDAAYGSLLLFRDNGNGITEPGELLTLEDAGIEAIELTYKNVNQGAAGGNRIAQVAAYRRFDGSGGLAADAVLNFTA